MSVTTTPLTAHVGVEIAGMVDSDLADPAVASECLAALDRYGVVVYRELNVSDADFVAFSRMLGVGPPITGIYRTLCSPVQPVGRSSSSGPAGARAPMRLRAGRDRTDPRPRTRQGRRVRS